MGEPATITLEQIYRQVSSKEITPETGVNQILQIHAPRVSMSIVKRIIENLDLLDEGVHTSYFSNVLDASRLLYLTQLDSFDLDPTEYTFRAFVDDVLNRSKKAAGELDALNENDQKRFWAMVDRVQEYL